MQNVMNSEGLDAATRTTRECRSTGTENPGLRGLIVCSGMPRGGSTLQYKLVRLLVQRCLGGQAGGWCESFDAFASRYPEYARRNRDDRDPLVIETHAFDARFAGLVDSGNLGHAFYVYRDVRDAVVSYARAFGEPVTGNAARWARSWIEWAEQWTSLARTTVSRYETLTEQPDREVRRYARALGVEPSDAEIRSIVAACSATRMRERSATVGNAAGFDSEYLVHAKHVRDGAWGRWRRELGSEERHRVWHVAGAWLESHGYPCYASPDDQDVPLNVSRLPEIDGAPPAVPRMRAPNDPLVRSFRDSLRSPRRTPKEPDATSNRIETANLFFGGTLEVRTGETVSDELLARGYFEEGLTWALLQCLRPGDTFFDVGAHLGYFSRLAAQLVGPAGRVVAFEPTPQTAERLRANLADCPQADVVQNAVTERSGEIDLLDFGETHSAFNSLYSPRIESPPEPAPASTIRVGAISLDQFCQESGIVPQFVKIDAESAELEILRGAKELLLRHRPIVSVEVGDLGEAGAPRSADVLEFASQLGYVAYEYVSFAEFVPHRLRERYAYDNLLLLPPQRNLRRDGRPATQSDDEQALRSALRRLATAIAAHQIEYGNLKGASSERQRKSDAATSSLHLAFVRRVWKQLGQRHSRVALFGAGRYARWLVGVIDADEEGPNIVCALDDAAGIGDTMGPVPVLRPSANALADVDAVVVATDDPESPLYARCDQVCGGVPVVNLYADVVGGPFPREELR